MTESFVYFIGKPNGAIKIGVARDVKRRLGELQVGNCSKLKVLATVPGSFDLEMEYQIRFHESRKRGEWYRRTPEILAEIKRIRDEQRDAALAILHAGKVQWDADRAAKVAAFEKGEARAKFLRKRRAARKRAAQTPTPSRPEGRL